VHDVRGTAYGICRHDLTTLSTNLLTNLEEREARPD